MKKLGMILTALTVLFLSACSANKNESNNTPTESAPPASVLSATSAPTVSPTSTPTSTPTPTPTPTPMPVKTLQEVEDELKNVKVSIDDLMNEDVVYPTYFGAVSDNLTNEVLKRTAYFESKGLNFDQAKALVAYLNYCYLNSDAVDKEKAERYLSIINPYDTAHLNRILEQIIKYNIENPNDQIIISWGAIGDALGKDGRAVINNRQQEMTKALINGKSFDSISISTEKYYVTLKQKDGSLMQLTGAYDDLNLSAKLMDIAIPYNMVGYELDTHGYSDSLDKAIQYFGNYRNQIFPAFNDPDNANVRRHGFDANAYYEEDLK